LTATTFAPNTGFRALRRDGPLLRLTARGWRIFTAEILFPGNHRASSLRTVSTSGSSGTVA
jgi:hypothetical protein